MRDVTVRVKVEPPTDAELRARAADDAIWLALHLAECAGWSDLATELLKLKQISGARRREAVI